MVFHGRALFFIAMTVMVSISSAAGPLQKNQARHQKGACCVEQHCERGCLGCSHKHCKHCDAPFAPILGSAPAMMAPVILTRRNQQPLPKQEDQTENELEKLRRLLELLDDLTPAINGEAAQQSSQLPAASPKPNVEEKLGSLESNLEKTVELLWRIQKDLSDLETRLEKLE